MHLFSFRLDQAIELHALIAIFWHHIIVFAVTVLLQFVELSRCWVFSTQQISGALRTVAQIDRLSFKLANSELNPKLSTSFYLSLVRLRHGEIT